MGVFLGHTTGLGLATRGGNDGFVCAGSTCGVTPHRRTNETFFRKVKPRSSSPYIYHDDRRRQGTDVSTRATRVIVVNVSQQLGKLREQRRRHENVRSRQPASHVPVFPPARICDNRLEPSCPSDSSCVLCVQDPAARAEAPGGRLSDAAQFPPSTGPGWRSGRRLVWDRDGGIQPAPRELALKPGSGLARA